MNLANSYLLELVIYCNFTLCFLVIVCSSFFPFLSHIFYLFNGGSYFFVMFFPLINLEVILCIYIFCEENSWISNTHNWSSIFLPISRVLITYIPHPKMLLLPFVPYSLPSSTCIDVIWDLDTRLYCLYLFLVLSLFLFVKDIELKSKLSLF